MKCPSCGNELGKKDKHCPNCGKKIKKPIYKKVWFWIVAIFIILVIAAAVSSDDSEETKEATAQEVEESAVSEQAIETESAETGEEPEAEPKVVSISAEYYGPTEEGTVLGENKYDFVVTAVYDDDSTKIVEDWSVEKTKTLKAGHVSTIAISYEDVSCKVKVECTTISEEVYKEQCQEIAYKDLARNPDEYAGELIKISGEVVQVLEEGSELTLRVATADYYEDIVMVSYTYKEGESRILEDDMITIWGTYYGTYTYESVLGGNVTVPAMLAEYIQLDES